MNASTAIRQVCVADLQNDLAQKLYEEHYDEITLDPENDKLAPNWDLLFQAESLGALVLLAAFVGDEIVGYSCTSLTPHIHYKDTTVATNHSLFVSKAHRASGVGQELMRETERLAAAAGAHVVLWHAKDGTQLDKLLARKYRLQDKIYSRRLQ